MKVFRTIFWVLVALGWVPIGWDVAHFWWHPTDTLSWNTLWPAVGACVCTFLKSVQNALAPWVED